MKKYHQRFCDLYLSVAVNHFRHRNNRPNEIIQDIIFEYEFDESGMSDHFNHFSTSLKKYYQTHQVPNNLQSNLLKNWPLLIVIEGTTLPSVYSTSFSKMIDPFISTHTDIYIQLSRQLLANGSKVILLPSFVLAGTDIPRSHQLYTQYTGILYTLYIPVICI